MDFGNITNLLSYLFLISMIAEKVTQVIKNGTALSGDTKLKQMIISAISIAAAGAAAYAVPPVDIFMLDKIGQVPAIVVCAILGSSGSGVWHDLIGIVTEYKKK